MRSRRLSDMIGQQTSPAMHGYAVGTDRQLKGE
jgi:hypothetical protein